MDFQTKMLLGTFAVTVLLGLIIVPILRKLKVGQIERTDGPQSHLKKQGTPTMGGIIIMLGIIIATCCAYVYYKGKDAALAQNLIPILCLTTGFGIIGFIDDYKKLVLKNTESLERIIKENKQKSLEVLNNKIITEANLNGGGDNITIITSKILK